MLMKTEVYNINTLYTTLFVNFSCYDGYENCVHGIYWASGRIVVTKKKNFKYQNPNIDMVVYVEPSFSKIRIIKKEKEILDCCLNIRLVECQITMFTV